MSSPWLAAPARAEAQRGLVRRLVRESWERSMGRHLDPDNLMPALAFDDDELREHRLGHPLAGVLPVITRLLVNDADDDSGMLVAVGDAMGRLLWVDGDRHLRRRAEGMLFVEGAGWSEREVGTSAPGTALELDHGIQIHAAEHFNRLVHPWSCTAVPVHDPETRQIIGVIDITGGAQAVASHALPLMEATAAAVESEIMVQRLRAIADRRSLGRARREQQLRRATPIRAGLQVLGRDTGLLIGHGAVTPTALSRRHAEILTLLSWHRQGLSADALAELLYDGDEAAVTLRAELVRLRRVLTGVAPALVPASRPYRLTTPLELDAHQVLSLLDRGAHRAALAAYPGPLLPDSSAPGIVELRELVATRLREAMLTDASVDLLHDYIRAAAAPDDAEVLLACLRLLPPRSPKRAGLVARIEAIEAELAAP
ncbi:MAG TPA: GAF domain-containing protein [Plantibacter sp.]|uniref:GAF domain-containing protein n=1 Tax=unclassified Plantibacter TaxID=2624265 RepID=UPI002B50CDB6|nr:GAF domain-containing protein [Plantibacter sp.]